MSAYRVRDAVVLQGQAIDACRYAVLVAQRARARAGWPPSKGLEVLMGILSESGHTDMAGDLDEQAGDMITTEQAAQMIGCSGRTIRRLAPGLGGRRVGGRWLLDRQAVADHVAGSEAR